MGLGLREQHRGKQRAGGIEEERAAEEGRRGVEVPSIRGSGAVALATLYEERIRGFPFWRHILIR